MLASSDLALPVACLRVKPSPLAEEVAISAAAGCLTEPPGGTLKSGPLSGGGTAAVGVASLAGWVKPLGGGGGTVVFVDAGGGPGGGGTVVFVDAVTFGNGRGRGGGGRVIGTVAIGPIIGGGPGGGGTGD